MQKRIAPMFVIVFPAPLVAWTAAVEEVVLFVPVALVPLAVADALLTWAVNSEREGSVTPALEQSV
jgi:hypothetical protein